MDEVISGIFNGAGSRMASPLLLEQLLRAGRRLTGR